jgi:hypothetical protein
MKRIIKSPRKEVAQKRSELQMEFERATIHGLETRLML